ncbi:MAG: xanthine dehydrogenase accessory factor [Bryobacteraceae bacterium]|nr:MAG: xanthine dehydrogenase accessory factor [Bryobacteraceae bacterium]
MDIYEEVVRLRRCGRKGALATIVKVNGSIPSYPGAKILVRDDGTFTGTIGGGCVEAEVWQTAREVMDSGRPRLLAFSLAEDAAYDNGLICGGQLEIYIEPVEPLPQAFLFGAGHISKSLARLCSMLGFSVTVIDDRESFANRERFPDADEIIAGNYEEIFPKLPVNSTSYLIIVTRGHRDDMRVLRWAATTPAAYVAMIGSRRKVISVVRELVREGMDPEQFRRVHAPMGLDIGAVTPEEIAVSVAAEMIAVRRRAASNWRALSMSVLGESLPEAIRK